MSMSYDLWAIKSPTLDVMLYALILVKLCTAFFSHFPSKHSKLRGLLKDPYILLPQLHEKPKIPLKSRYASLDTPQTHTTRADFESCLIFLSILLWEMYLRKHYEGAFSDHAEAKINAEQERCNAELKIKLALITKYETLNR